MVRSLSIALSSLLLFFVFSTARAQGFNLSWGDCGSHGTALETLACDSDVGHRDLIVSIVLASPMPSFVGAEAVLRMYVEGGIPDWWRFQVGQCRSGVTSLVLDLDAEPTSCANPFVPGIAGGLLWETTVEPAELRVRMAAAIPTSNALDAGVEYALFRIRIPNTLTSTCSGCSTPACIGIDRVLMAQPQGVGSQYYYIEHSSGVVGWQCPSLGYVSDSPYICLIDPRCATATVSPTWGSIKALYR